MTRFPNLARRPQGFSLVELMVAALIGMLAIAAITQSYLSGENTKRRLSASSDSIVGGTLALYMLEREVRSAGFGLANGSLLGCSVGAAFKGDMASPNPADTTAFLPPIFPFTFAPITITQGAVTDQVTALYATSESIGLPVKLTSTVSGPTPSLFVATNYFFNESGLIILANSGGCTLMQVATRDSLAPNLLHIDVTSPWNSDASIFPPGGFPIGSSVFDMGAMGLKRFFVNAADATFRMTEVSNAGTAAKVSAETTILMKGVVGMKAQYGYAASVNNSYVDPASGWSSKPPASNDEWQRVVAVRLALALRPAQRMAPPSLAGGACTTETPKLQWSGGDLPIVDSVAESTCYRYQVYETTIPIRNRIWTL